MASTVSFRSEVSEQKKGIRKKRMVSRGLLIAFLFSLVAVAAWLSLYMWEKSVASEVNDINSRIKQVQKETRDKLHSGDALDFAMRARFVEKELYRGRTTNDVLDEVERIMVINDDAMAISNEVRDLVRARTGLTEEELRRADSVRDILGDAIQENDINAIFEKSNASGDRVVLRSFEHNAGAYQEEKSDVVSRVITGPGTVTITADADSFDVMAQQIEKFKRSDYFENVLVGTTDRDDAGRIVFTLTMDVKKFEKTPYEVYSPGVVVDNMQKYDFDDEVQVDDFNTTENDEIVREGGSFVINEVNDEL